MCWRGGDIDDRFWTYQSLASVALFAWLLGVLGVYDSGWRVHLLLAAAVGFVAAAAVREDGQTPLTWRSRSSRSYWAQSESSILSRLSMLLAIAVVMLVPTVVPARRNADEAAGRS